jgi:putative transposase
VKALFEHSRDSLGSREMKKELREEGFTIGRHKPRKLMKKMKLKQRIAYKVTTKRNDRDKVEDNLLNQNLIWLQQTKYGRDILLI